MEFLRKLYKKLREFLLGPEAPKVDTDLKARIELLVPEVKVEQPKVEEVVPEQPKVEEIITPQPKPKKTKKVVDTADTKSKKPAATTKKNQKAKIKSTKPKTVKTK